jgi:hypothetical protein
MPPRAARRRAAPAKPAATALNSEQQHGHSKEKNDGAESALAAAPGASAADARAYAAFKSKVDEHVSRLDTDGTVLEALSLCETRACRAMGRREERGMRRRNRFQKRARKF